MSELERQGRLRRHETSAQEVADLLRIAEEGLADARVEAVTLDRRFCAAMTGRGRWRSWCWPVLGIGL